MNNQMESTEQVLDQVDQAVPQKKKSELLAEQKELFEINEKLLKEMQEREYSIDIKSKKIFI